MTTQCTTNNSVDPFSGEYDTPHGTIPFDKISNKLYEPAFQKGIDLQVEEINAIFDEYIGGNSDNWRKVWAIYTFLVWYEEYFVKR